MSRPQRTKAAVERFAPVELREVSALVIPTGAGVKLGDSPHFVDGIAKLTGDDDLVRNLHNVLFKRPGTKTTRKKNLKLFSGFENPEDKEKKVTSLSSKAWTQQMLKDLAGLVGVEKGGSKEDLAARLVDYLAAPTVVGSTGNVKAPKKRKAEKPAKGAKRVKRSKGDKPKRGPNSYMIYANGVRAKVMADNPGIGVGECGRIIGKMWRKLSDEEKQEYKDQSDALKEKLVAAAAEAADAEEEPEENEDEEEEPEEKEGEEAEENGDDAQEDEA